MSRRTERPAIIQRRTFMASGAMAALLALLPEPLQPARAAAADDPLNALWRDSEAACVVGRCYLAQVPEEADAGRLLQCLFATGEGRCTLSPESLVREIAARRARDFAEGDTVILDGWVLARTEARICALTALGLG